MSTGLSPLLAVIVTYGMRPNFAYARDLQSMDDARRMRDTARHYGYRDAVIVDQAVFDRHVNEIREYRRHEARQIA